MPQGGDNLQKILLKHFTAFVIGALIYGMIEISARGFTHITMGLLGGISMIVIHLTNDARRDGLNFFVQISLIAFFITAIEFITGEIVNVRLGMNIWDYSDIPLNFDGQICLPFVGIWLVLSAIGVVLDDYLRWKMFREDKNFSYLKTVNTIRQA